MKRFTANDFTLDSIRRHLILEDGEQRRLIVQAQAGDIAARNAVVECNGKLVIHWALKKQSKKVDLDDLVSAGFVGLIRAVELFDVGFICKHGTLTKFSTFASNHINVKMSEEHKRRYIIKVPLYQQYALNKVAKGQKVSMSPKRTSSMKYAAAVMNDGSWVGLMDDGNKTIDMVEDRSYHTDSLEAGDNVKQVNALRRKLLGQQQLVLVLRFGLDGGGSRTLTECGEIMGITKERCRQIEIAAINRLKELTNDVR